MTRNSARQTLAIVRSSDERTLGRLLDSRHTIDPSLERKVATIIDKVRRDGDPAVAAYARRFDRMTPPLEVTREEIEAGRERTAAPLLAAIRQAIRRIRSVARRQVPKSWRIRTAPGVELEQRVTPLDRVGCYVPAGRYPLPSSLLMTVVPARAAGVREVIVVCPRPSPTVLAAAAEADVNRMFKIGGAHAIAALAYGTATIPRVDKIVGPGSAFVAAAKARVAPDCPIDLHAGPSEIAIVAAAGNAQWMAADLIAQAEHDPGVRALLFTPSANLAAEVAREVERQLPANPGAGSALTRQGGIIVTASMIEAIALVNRMAPEHLVCESDEVAAAITSAGAIFVGRFAAQAAGDYATGSNHVLPTGGAARSRGGLSASDFVRTTSVQRLTKKGLSTLAPVALALAEAEGLKGHAASIAIRLDNRSQARREKSKSPD